jgi:hypothetical protein
VAIVDDGRDGSLEILGSFLQLAMCRLRCKILVRQQKMADRCKALDSGGKKVSEYINAPSDNSLT